MLLKGPLEFKNHRMPQGTLFTEDFLSEGIRETEAWRAISATSITAFRTALQSIFDKVPHPSRLNEPQTEERIIQPVLKALDWADCYSVQERAEAKGRANVPDYPLFRLLASLFKLADQKRTASERYPFAIAVADAKAWGIGLDQRGAGAAGGETPSGQIIRYLSRADAQSDGKVLWGILTSGRYWRLYYQRAKSRLEEYFEVDLAWVLALPGTQGEFTTSQQPTTFATGQEWSDHLLKVMWLMFRRGAFLPEGDGRTFHEIALDEGRNWEARVRESLADIVFGAVFPDLIRALVRADPMRPGDFAPSYLATVRDAALTLLYRLLFALYAEDRDLLPKRDPRYGGLSRLRDEVAERFDAGTALSRRRTAFAHDCADLFRTIDKGDDDIGVPPYNGGLFTARTDATELLDRSLLPDADFVPLLDRLARTEKDGRRARINFRDLSVRQLGSIYERLLEYEPVPDPTTPDGIGIRLNPFARKGSGSYYTPDELVSLIIRRTIGPLVREKFDAFSELAAKLASDRRSKEMRVDDLRRIDPAEEILKLRIVDPAMGSGHFLVSLVDYLAEQIMSGYWRRPQAVTWADYVSRWSVALLMFGQGFARRLTPISGRLPSRPAGLTEEALGMFDEGGQEQLAMNGLGGAGTARDFRLIGDLIKRAHALAAEQRLLHWQIGFPGVWKNWTSAEPDGGFDAVIGNPPWDRMKMQEVEWFAARAPDVAHQGRATDRKKKIADMKAADDPLIADYERASARADKAMELARHGGDYPLLSRGDLNIYALFVERSQALIKPNGIAGLLVPSGIASDLNASSYFRKVATSGRVQCLFDFENRRGEGRESFFPDIDSRFKFCAFVCGAPNRTVAATECAFFLRDPPERVADDQRFSLTVEDFTLVNPNTGTAPIFRTKRDAELTTAIYRRLPVLVVRTSNGENKAWPVRYMRMFDMTNDSQSFWTRARLEKEGAYPTGLGRWQKASQEWVPLWEGKMVQAFDHRAAHIVVNPENVHRPAQPESMSEADHVDPDLVPSPQYWIKSEQVSQFSIPNTVVGFKEITSPTNERTMIAAFLPQAGYGNTIPILYPESSRFSPETALWLGSFNSIALDFCARQKIQGQHLNWFIVEQLPVLTPAHYTRRFGRRTAAEIVKDHVLRLTYTAYDMAPFARDMGYVNPDGSVKPPIIWSEVERRHLRARLDALYFMLYEVTAEDDIRYILSTFPIVERKDRERFDDVYLTQELILWYKRALEAGDAGSTAPEADLIRLALKK